jgi:hypothetical protein
MSNQQVVKKVNTNETWTDTSINENTLNTKINTILPSGLYPPKLTRSTAVCYEYEKSTPKVCQLHGCKRKLKITAFDCRCGRKFCKKHQSFDLHECEYYKCNGRNNYSPSHVEKLIYKMRCVEDKINRL